MQTPDAVFETIDQLDGVMWTDMEAALDSAKDILEELGSNPRLLGGLIDISRQEERSRRHFERHRLLDKIHLYESPSGIRLRLHVSTDEHRDRPHDHRFSFVSSILRGGYLQTRHKLIGDLSEVAASCQNDSDAPRVDVTVVPMFQTFQAAGSIYSLRHSEIHTTYTEPRSVSLFLRGPAEQQRSIITERDSGAAWWRYGRADESHDRRRKVSMDDEHLATVLANLTAIGVVR